MNQSFSGLNQRSFLLAGLIAGLGIGLLSTIPFVNCLNCLLFAWVWGGGIAAVSLYRRYEKQPFVPVAQGLFIGALAGAIGAVVGGLLSILFGGIGFAVSDTLRQVAGDTGSSISNFLFSTGFNFFSMLWHIILYGVIGAIGGFIATTFIWKQPLSIQAPPPPYNPPPPPAPES
ncbi:MAG: hypothetical protein ACM3PY_09780 [Omnitrophica WOR_2 bacterium]